MLVIIIIINSSPPSAAYVRHEPVFQWNLNQNTKFFIHRNAFENGGCEMAAILSMVKWVLIKMMIVESNNASINRLWHHQQNVIRAS